MSKAIVEMYRKRVRGRVEWRWRITHRNRRIIGASTESYRKRVDCLKNLCTVTRGKFYIPPRNAAKYEWNFPSGAVRSG